jgi:hypothetical protein
MRQIMPSAERKRKLMCTPSFLRCEICIPRLSELNQLSGVAALLRFPMPEVEVMGESKGSDSEEENDIYPVSTAPAPSLHATSSVSQLSAQLPGSTAAATAAAASAAEKDNYFKNTAPHVPSSVSFNNLAAMSKAGGTGAPSPATSSTAPGMPKIIQGFARKDENLV